MRTTSTLRSSRTCSLLLPGLAVAGTLLCSTVAHADYALADQSISDGNGRRGFLLYLDSAKTVAPQVVNGQTMPGLQLQLRMGDGVNWRWVNFGQPLNFGTRNSSNYYWVKAVITPGVKTELYFKDVLVKTDTSTFTLAPFTSDKSLAIPDTDVVNTGLDYNGSKAIGTTDYVVRQTALRITEKISSTSSVSKQFTFPPSIASPTLFALNPQNPIRDTWTTDAGKTLTIEASFYLEPSVDTTTLAGPVVDAFGQSKDASWSGTPGTATPGKVTSLANLKTDWNFEESQYATAAWSQSTQYDSYGGYKDSSSTRWIPAGTNGYFRLAQNPNNKFWWLVSPSGNPCFYIGMDSVVGSSDTSLYTGREKFFPPTSSSSSPTETQLPSMNNSAFPVWANTSDGNKAFSFLGYNLAKRYGSSYSTTALNYANTRAKVWGFSGFGKWSTPLAGVPLQPVIPLPPESAVHHLTDNLFDPWDPSVKSALAAYISGKVSGRKTDPTVLGWSFGNESDGTVWNKDIVTMLKLVNNSTISAPVKHELVNYMRYKYGLNNQTIADLADAWNIPISTTARNAAVSNPLMAQREIEANDFSILQYNSYGTLTGATPALLADLPTMRRYFAGQYYDLIYKDFKAADSNHLYFGFWITLGNWEDESDWTLISQHCDVIGYDYYDYSFAPQRLSHLISLTKKPVMCGEFSFPADYGGQRGYGSYGVSVGTDAEMGSLYTQWVKNGATNPYCVGMHWFQYHDQPVLGRGTVQSGTTPRLTLDEHFAFGLADITDRPKWDLVKPARAANLNAAPLRLGISAPVLPLAPPPSGKVAGLPAPKRLG